MEPLRDGQPGPNECWEELAEHSLTHDDLPPVGGRMTATYTRTDPDGATHTAIITTQRRLVIDDRCTHLPGRSRPVRIDVRGRRSRFSPLLAYRIGRDLRRDGYTRVRSS